MAAEFEGVILSLLSIEENYESPYVVYRPGGHTYIHDWLFYQDAAAQLAVDKAISYTLLPFHVFIMGLFAGYPSHQCCSQWRRERVWYMKERYTHRDTGIEKIW